MHACIHNLDKFPRLYGEQMNPVSKAYMLFGSIYLTVCEKQNYSDEEQICGGQHPGAGGGLSLQGEHEGVFWGDGRSLYSSTCKMQEC